MFGYPKITTQLRELALKIPDPTGPQREALNRSHQTQRFSTFFFFFSCPCSIYWHTSLPSETSLTQAPPRIRTDFQSGNVYPWTWLYYTPGKRIHTVFKSAL